MSILPKVICKCDVIRIKQLVAIFGRNVQECFEIHGAKNIQDSLKKQCWRLTIKNQNLL